MELNEIPIDDLRPHPQNPREHPEKAIQKLMRSIEEFGWTNPVIVKESDGTILAGHARIKAAKKLGREMVPAIEVDLTGADADAYMLADNRIQAETEWDQEELADILNELTYFDMDISLTGFDEEEIEDILAMSEPGEDGPTGDIYSDKVDTPVYEIEGPKPEIYELYDDDKAQRLLDEVESMDVDDDLKQFLMFACYRQIVFDYEQIAEFYAHSDAEIQEIFEKLHLVIVDIGRAIEDGLTTFTKEVLDDVLFGEDQGS